MPIIKNGICHTQSNTKNIISGKVSIVDVQFFEDFRKIEL